MLHLTSTNRENRHASVTCVLPGKLCPANSSAQDKVTLLLPLATHKLARTSIARISPPPVYLLPSLSMHRHYTSSPDSRLAIGISLTGTSRPMSASLCSFSHSQSRAALCLARSRRAQA